MTVHKYLYIDPDSRAVFTVQAESLLLSSLRPWTDARLSLIALFRWCLNYSSIAALAHLYIPRSQVRESLVFA